MGCGGSKSSDTNSGASGAPRPASSNSANPTAKFEVEGGIEGSFEAEIYLDRVPRTASNFIDLCNTEFYNGVHFHRVIPKFMCQFGCPNAKDPKSQKAGTGGPPDGTFTNLKTNEKEKRFNGGCIKDENISKDTNAPGSLSMANTGQKDSGGSQFFLNVANNDFLDWFSPGDSKHPVFGKITSNFELVQKISNVKTTNDNPNVPIKMKRITITMNTNESN